MFVSDRQRLRIIAMAAAEDFGIPPEAFADAIDQIMEDIKYYISSGQGDALDAVLHVARQRGVTV
jgi:hypothetical protein